MKRILSIAILFLLLCAPAFAGEVKIDPRWGEGFDITQDWCSRPGSEVDGRACMDKRGNFFPNFVYLFKPDHSMVYYYPKGHREHEGHPTWEIKSIPLNYAYCREHLATKVETSYPEWQHDGQLRIYGPYSLAREFSPCPEQEKPTRWEIKHLPGTDAQINQWLDEHPGWEPVSSSGSGVMVRREKR